MGAAYVRALRNLAAFAVCAAAVYLLGGALIVWRLAKKPCLHITYARWMPALLRASHFRAAIRWRQVAVIFSCRWIIVPHAASVGPLWRISAFGDWAKGVLRLGAHCEAVGLALHRLGSSRPAFFSHWARRGSHSLRTSVTGWGTKREAMVSPLRAHRDRSCHVWLATCSVVERSYKPYSAGGQAAP